MNITNQELTKTDYVLKQEMPNFFWQYTLMSDPAYEKIAIGAAMAVSEGIFCGNMMESAKILRQSTHQPYLTGLRGLYQRGGLYGLLYTGYFPAGIFQASTKGLPVLFVKGEVSKRLENQGWKRNTAALLGGIASGIAQGVVVAPTQRLRSLALTNTTGIPAMEHIRNTIKKEGLRTIIRGTPAMCARRGVDWALRFSTLEYIRRTLFDFSGEKKTWHTIAGAFLGGSVSALTLPLDCLIAQSQKTGSTGNVIQVAKRMYAENGLNAFSRGLLGRVVHSGYHTCFVAGLGTVIYETYFEEKKSEHLD
jgi:hypothetical protein